MNGKINTECSTAGRSELPSTFIDAMRTLFDIMDVNKSGMVRFRDIESRWQDDPRKGLPKGVIENLRKVTPPSGLITFSQFCAGLKLSLASLKCDDNAPVDGKDVNNNRKAPTRNRPASVPIPSYSIHPVKKNSNENTSENSKATSTHKNITRSVSSRPVSGVPRPNTARVEPNNAMALRAMSMPHLGEKYSSQNGNHHMSPPPFIAPPPVKPNPQHLRKDIPSKKEPDVPACPPSALNKSGIMTVLQKWRLEKLRESKDVDSTDSDVNEWNRNKAIPRTGSSSGNIHQLLSEAPPKPPRSDFHTMSDNGQYLSSDLNARNVAPKKSYNRRKEPRRHTVANGIDYNMLKRMKQMEQEKDVLVQGLESVDKAKEWYLKQIQTVQDKMKYVGRNGSIVESSSDAYQERLNFQMARIFEVNQHLSALVESTDKGFPLHMNLALRQPPLFKLNKSTADDSTVQRLKQQNSLLSEEVHKKGDRITQLEREKAALIRELFQARSQHRRESDDNTLM